MHRSLSRSLTLFTCALAVAMIAHGQAGNRRFTPQWKVGDKRTTTTTRHEQKMKYGAVEEDTTYVMNSTFSVIAEDKTTFTLEVHYSNVALRAAASFYDRIGEELKEYEDLVLKYKVEKTTGKADLINWKDAQQFMDKSFKAIHAVIEKKVPEMADFMDLVFAPIETMFESKENIEAYMESEIGFLLFPFGKTFTSDTLRVVESAPNPFNPQDTVDQTTLSWLVDRDGPGGMCEVHSTVLFDLSSFKEMIKTMMKKMAGSLDVADSTAARQSREIDEMEFTLTNGSVITLDESTTWPLKVEQTGHVVSSDPKGRQEKSIEAKTTLR